MAAMNDASIASAHLQPHPEGRLRRLFMPLNIAAYITWAAIFASAVDFDALRGGNARGWAGATALIVVLALFAECAMRPSGGVGLRQAISPLLQGVLVVFAVWALKGGQLAVLLIIVASQLVLMLDPRVAALCIAALNAPIAWIWYSASGSLAKTLLWMMPVLGFQAFAALTGHFAGSSERARAHLARVNAELLATRRLLEESARAGERLKLSRELHDVAGHSLTALKLNLARLARDPALADREELHISTQLADELLAQIREVVGALRAHDGLDLRAALDALAQTMPGTRVEVEIEDGLRVDDMERAQTLLRCAQEAITNAVRHGRAGHVRLQLRRRDDALELLVDNDGATPAKLVPGHGLTGMRERLLALGGTLDIVPHPPRGLRLCARIPETA